MKTNILNQRVTSNMLAPISAYIQLTKPRILFMVLITATMGYFLAEKPNSLSSLLLIYTLIGMGLVVGGAGTLNHYFEREIDKKMQRTCERVLPKGELHPLEALIFGTVLILSGSTILFLLVNTLTTILVLSAAFLYVFIYTPLKRITWWNTFIGAIPGAIPPVAGWAATGGITMEAWILFLILFSWQHPHFFAIAWMYRDDYKKGGFKMLPVVQPDGKNIFFQVIFYSFIMVIASLSLYFYAHMGYIYLVGAIVIGILFCKKAVLFCVTKNNITARLLLKASVIYLPVLLLLICIDNIL